MRNWLKNNWHHVKVTIIMMVLTALISFSGAYFVGNVFIGIPVFAFYIVFIVLFIRGNV